MFLLLITLLTAPVLAQEPAPEPTPRETAFLERVQAASPERYAHLVELRASDPEAYAHALRRMRRLTRVAGDGVPDEAIARALTLHERLEELGEGYDTLPAREQAARDTEMHALAAELFDLRQAYRRQKVEDLEARLADLRAEIEERERRRDEVIDRFLTRYTGDRVPGL